MSREDKEVLRKKDKQCNNLLDMIGKELSQKVINAKTITSLRDEYRSLQMEVWDMMDIKKTQMKKSKNMRLEVRLYYIFSN
jgi:hypothetical protein